MRVPNPAYPRDRVFPGAMARLLSENWDSMTAAARTSDRHPSSLARWEQIARDANPGLSDAQYTRAAELLRSQHYQRMGQLSGQARRLAAEAGAELARADGEA